VKAALTGCFRPLEEDMADQQAAPAGPDLSQVSPSSEFSGAILLGHVGDEDVLLVRSVS